VASLLAVIAVIGFLLLRYKRPLGTGELQLPEKGIAIMPFENRSEDKANAYFAEGIQDEILTRLSKIADLKVISRTSTQHYKSAPENLREIAKQLGVAHVLEGSVQKSGDTVRVNVQLIRAANDSHLWADTFDRKLTDIFFVESEVARVIADQLRAKLTGEEEQEIADRRTNSCTLTISAYIEGAATRISVSTRNRQLAGGLADRSWFSGNVLFFISAKRLELFAFGNCPPPGGSNPFSGEPFYPETGMACRSRYAT
jgi:TolB-like protein